ncbi:hypothetical protein CC80DRAFT_592137 [Byssothecium circinans]|uniref:NmrA-like domain-containing protein n=1 Tax=Byssothecium circinans TaxID=147558 RepID=A0A6A5U2B8_9PLEO|nr:hypothetical protein CC80DRAFT_592137 [Byssothecium circinans]
MAIKNVLVIGDRNLARSIVRALSLAPTLKRTTAYEPDDVPPTSITHKTSDFTSSSIEVAFKGEDVVISTVFGGNFEMQTSIFDAVIAAGVKRFIPHEFGYDSLNIAIQGRISGAAERAIVIERLRRASLEWVGVAVGCILDSTLLNSNLGFDLAWQRGTINGTGSEPFPETSLTRVGIMVERILQHCGKVKNEYVYAAGIMTSGDEIAVSLEKNTQSLDHPNVEDCVREGRSRIERGFLDSGMFLLERSVLYDKSSRTAEPFMDRSGNGLLGLEPETLDGIVGQVAHDFKHHGKPSCGCSS